MILRILTGGYGHMHDDRCDLILRGETVDVPDDEAKALIAIGAAEKVVATGQERAEGPELGENTPEPEAPQESAEGPKTLDDMTVAELKAYAEDALIDVSGCKRKAEIIARILEEENGADDGETPPDVSAEAPVE